MLAVLLMPTVRLVASMVLDGWMGSLSHGFTTLHCLSGNQSSCMDAYATQMAEH